MWNAQSGARCMEHQARCSSERSSEKRKPMITCLPQRQGASAQGVDPTWNAGNSVVLCNPSVGRSRQAVSLALYPASLAVLVRSRPAKVWTRIQGRQPGLSCHLHIYANTLLANVWTWDAGLDHICWHYLRRFWKLQAWCLTKGTGSLKAFSSRVCFISAPLFPPHFPFSLSAMSWRSPATGSALSEVLSHHREGCMPPRSMTETSEPKSWTQKFLFVRCSFGFGDSGRRLHLQICYIQFQNDGHILEDLRKTAINDSSICRATVFDTIQASVEQQCLANTRYKEYGSRTTFNLIFQYYTLVMSTSPSVHFARF